MSSYPNCVIYQLCKLGQNFLISKSPMFHMPKRDENNQVTEKER